MFSAPSHSGVFSLPFYAVAHLFVDKFPVDGVDRTFDGATPIIDCSLFTDLGDFPTGFQGPLCVGEVVCRCFLKLRYFL